MEKEFIPYTEALALKELGFDEPCIQQYSYEGAIMFCVNGWGQPRLKTNKQSYSDSGGDCISAPTFSQAFRWFREKYGLSSTLGYYVDWKYSYHIYSIHNSYTVEMVDNFDIYEEAELECLKKLIEIVKNK